MNWEKSIVGTADYGQATSLKPTESDAVDVHPSTLRRRVSWLEVVFAGMGLALLYRVACWQLFSPNSTSLFSAQADAIPAARGSVLDATGQYLAVTTVKYAIGVSPELLSEEQKQKYVPVLADIFSMPEARVIRMLSSNGYTPIISDTVVTEWPFWAGEEIKALDLAAFSLEPRFRRTYPDGSLAASVLGFTDFKGEAHYGVELYHDEQLRGVDGQWEGVTDSWGRYVLASPEGYEASKNGADLFLTLDRNIQHMAETLLLEGIQEYEAASGNIIVLDPNTGAILAMANYPTYRPEEPANVESWEQYVNSAISDIYEPGSVFKPLTLAAALEARVVRPTDTYDDRGVIIVGGQSIQNSDKKAHGPTTMMELLAHSRNVGAGHLAALLGPTRFYEIMKRFGFSEVTGVDLAYEVRGLMRVPGDVYWHMSDLGTNSFGQGIAVTPLQVVAAYGALANDGMLMRPYVMREIHDGNRVEKREPVAVRQVVSPQVARETSELMADAVELGMGEAILDGYRMAGKSGTSGVPDPEGYQNSDIIASYVGFGPLPDPRFVILTKFDKPQASYWGLEVAAPVFKKMAKYLVDYYAIPPTQ